MDRSDARRRSARLPLVLLDNGRTAALADAIGRAALNCIRCSACLNVCPVYERTGGHAYGSTYPGPIGAVLTPQLAGMHAAKDDPNNSLPYASSLCGACFDACPVKIDIPSLLVELRHQHTERTGVTPERLAMRAAAAVMRRPALYTAAQKASGLGRVIAGRDGTISRLPPPLSGWSDSRDTAAPPRETFRSWFASEEGTAALRAAAAEHDAATRGGHGTTAPGGDHDEEDAT